MGAGGSVESVGQEPYSLEAAQALAGGSWSEDFKESFNERADPDTGLVAPAVMKDFIDEFDLNASQRFSTGKNSINGASTSRWLLLKVIN